MSFFGIMMKTESRDSDGKFSGGGGGTEAGLKTNDMDKAASFARAVGKKHAGAAKIHTALANEGTGEGDSTKVMYHGAVAAQHANAAKHYKAGAKLLSEGQVSAGKEHIEQANHHAAEAETLKGM